MRCRRAVPAPGGGQVGAARQREAVLLVAQQLEEAGDRGERRSQLVGDRGHEGVAQPLEAAVGRHLAQRPDPADEGSVGPGTGVVEPRKTRPVSLSSNSSSLAVVIVRELAHPFAEATRLGRPVGEREQSLGHGAVRRQPELQRDLLERRVCEEQPSGSVGEADAVERRVEQCPLHRARLLQLERIGRNATRGVAGGEADSDEGG